MGVAEIRHHSRRAEELEVVLAVIVHLGCLQELCLKAQGFRVPQEGVQPDAVIDGRILDLPVSPVVVAERPALHFPGSAPGVIRKRPDGPSQAFGAERGPVHRPPFLGP